MSKRDPTESKEAFEKWVCVGYGNLNPLNLYYISLEDYWKVIGGLAKLIEPKTIIIEKVDGVLDVVCRCGNHIVCQDGIDEFEYKCAHCPTTYTNINPKEAK